MRLLLGVDLRVDGHEWLLDRAAWFATRIGATIDMVYVSDTDEPHPRLTAMVDSLPEAVRGQALVRKGLAEDVLVRMSNDYDALVIGPREPGALERFLKGTMAVRVLRRTRAPVLVPRGGGPGEDPLKVVVGVDIGGDRPERLVSWAGEWGAKLGAQVDGLFAIVANLPPIKNATVREQAERAFRASHKPEQAQLQSLLEVVPRAHRGQAVLRRGEAEDALVELSGGYDLVVVGNRERAGLTRLLIGNVAHHVVRNAACDVLVLPTAADEAPEEA